MKIIFLLVFSIFVIGIFGFSSETFASEKTQICIDKVWLENKKGKIACVSVSTASTLVERGWGTILENSDNFEVLGSIFPLHPEKMKHSAPVPDTAKGPQIDFSKGYLVEEIRDGLYLVTDGAYNTMFLTTGQGVIQLILKQIIL